MCAGSFEWWYLCVCSLLCLLSTPPGKPENHKTLLVVGVFVFYLQACMISIGQKKAVTLETVRAVKFILKLFHLNALKVRDRTREQFIEY